MPFDIDLTGQQFEEFEKALLHAFPSYPGLERMLRFKVSKRLPEIAAPGPMTTVVYQLIEKAIAEYWLQELLDGALAENPRNPLLRELALEVSMTSTSPPKGGFESRVLGIARAAAPGMVDFQDVVHWRQRMAEAEQCVCRIEIPRDVPEGTGFLVAPDIVMTNWHVAKLLQEKECTPDRVNLRFDYKEDANKSIPDGPHYALAPEWQLVYSETKELDYALIRLAGRPGDQRGKLVPAAYALTPDFPLFIIQHPDGEPMKIQAGSITAFLEQFQRVQYTTNTLGGSSGSPCFALDWRAIAIHHYGQETSNVGISLAAIQADVKKKADAALRAELQW